MPLYHVGGIVRTVLAVWLSGGSSICCPSFLPSLVWELVAQRRFTWLYAGPTHHQMILEDRHAQPAAVLATAAAGHVRMIANAAGGLLPTLARELRACFACTVLPSYGAALGSYNAGARARARAGRGSRAGACGAATHHCSHACRAPWQE